MKAKEITSALNQIVSYKNVFHKLTGVTIRKDEDGNIYYVAEIKSLTAKNSFCWVDLEDVENV